MSDKEHSPAASPRHEDDNDSRSPKSPRAGSASPKSAADDAEGASTENVGRRATSRSPSPVGGAAAAGGATNERGAVRTEPDAANPGNNLYIANLPDRFTQSDMEELFNKFGRVEKCEVIIDPVTRESRGFGFVSYEDVRDATDAVAELNGKEVQGRRIRVEHAKRQRGHEKTPGKYLGPRQASTKYGIRGMSGGRSRSRSRGDRGGDRGDRFRPRSRSRSRDRGRRYDSYDSRDRYDRGRYEDRGRGYDRDRYERRSRR